MAFGVKISELSMLIDSWLYGWLTDSTSAPLPRRKIKLRRVNKRPMPVGLTGHRHIPEKKLQLLHDYRCHIRRVRRRRRRLKMNGGIRRSTWDPERHRRKQRRARARRRNRKKKRKRNRKKRSRSKSKSESRSTSKPKSPKPKKEKHKHKHRPKDREKRKERKKNKKRKSKAKAKSKRRERMRVRVSKKKKKKKMMKMMKKKKKGKKEKPKFQERVTSKTLIRDILGPEVNNLINFSAQCTLNHILHYGHINVMFLLLNHGKIKISIHDMSFLYQQKLFRMVNQFYHFKQFIILTL
jgi:hypothetical protein